MTETEYTDPSDLFVNGVIDTRRGTCGNMSTLYVAMCWRLKWPVYLACAKSHLFARYDDGSGSTTSRCLGPMRAAGARPRRTWRRLGCTASRRRPSAAGRTCGLKPREALGIFFGHRARHNWDVGRQEESEGDYLLDRYLFPNNRSLYFNALGAQIFRGPKLFHPGEMGHPSVLPARITAPYPNGFPGEQAFSVEGDYIVEGEPWKAYEGGPPVRLIRPPADMWNPVIATLNELPEMLPVYETVVERIW